MNATTSFHRCWTNETIDIYFTTEAMAKTKEAFLEVHLPIEQIRVDRQYNAFQELGQREFIDEEALKNLILGSTPQLGNRVFSIIGETGSGKSELCQWLYYKIQDADSIHVPILIRRSMTKLRDIVAVIYEQLGEVVPSQTRDITDLWEEFVSKQLVASMLQHLQNETVLAEIGTANGAKLRKLIADDKTFELTMRDNFVHYRDEIQRLDKARELNLLPEKQFAKLVFDAGGLATGTAAICYGHLQRAITDCLTDTLRVENVIEKLHRISDGFRRQGKRPMLLIEDITTFSFLQNDLLDYLFDLGSGNFDVLIGITTDFERTNEQQIYKAQQTIRERTEGRFVLTNDKNETLFLKENYVRLAQLYLRAVKNKQCPVCSDERINKNFGEYLYPFNEQFLQNIYANLQQDGNRKQTPRLYLRALGQTLRNQVMLPFEYIELANVGSPTAWYSDLGINFSQLEKLLKWYGLNTNQGIFLPNVIVKAFGTDSPAKVDTVNDHYRFNVRPPGDKTLPPPPPDIISEKKQPVINQVSPREGLINTPNTLTITGTNFEPGCTALLNDQKLNVRRISEKQLQITIPSNLALGTYTLTIINPNQSQTTFPNAYTTKEPFSPSISLVQPNEGEENLSNMVYVNGQNFHRDCTVYFGNNKMKAQWLGSTKLEISVPSSLSPSSYDLIVKNPDDKQSRISKAYTVRPEDLFGQLDQWIDRHGQFPGRTKFKDGLWQLLDMFELKPFELKSRYSIADSGTAITFSRGDRTSQIYLYNSADSLPAGHFKLTIHPQKELRNLYSQVLAVGQGHYEIDDVNHLDHPLLYEWLEQRVAELQQEMSQSLAQALNMPLEQFILAAKFLLLNNFAGVNEFSAESLTLPIIGEPFTIGSMGDRPKQLFAWRNEIQALFIGVFHFRDSVINYPYLRHVVDSMKPTHAVAGLRNIDSDKVYDAFYIGSHKNQFSLRGLAQLISQYAREIFVIQQGKNFVTAPPIPALQGFFDLLQPIDQISALRLQKQLDQLRQLCLRNSFNWSSAWDTNLSSLHHNPEKLDFPAFARQFQQLLKYAAEAEKEPDVFTFLRLQREVKTLTGLPEFEVLATTHRVYHSIEKAFVNISGLDNLKKDPNYVAFAQAFEEYRIGADA